MRSLPALLCILLAASPAFAAEIRRGDQVVVGRGEVLEGDLYAIGSSVRIEGEVRGDVVAFAQTVDVSGRVLGDLISASQTVRASGSVGGSVRSAANSVELVGQVGRDAVLAGQKVRLAPEASVAQDLIVAGEEVRVLAPVGGTVRSAAQTLALDAPVKGDVRARAGSISIGDKGTVGGVLSYAAPKEAQIASGAQIGSVQRLPAPARPSPIALFLVGWLRLTVGLFLLGLLFRLVAPRLSRSALSTLRSSPWKSLGIGAAALIAVPLAAILLGLAGALVGGWWIGLVVLVALAVAATLAFPLVGLLAGEAISRRWGASGVRLALPLLVGVLLLALAMSIPVLGALVALAALLWGLGALLLGGWNLRHLPAEAPA